MNRTFKRSLLSGLVISAFGLAGANLAVAADTDTMATPGTDATRPVQPSTSTSTSTTTTTATSPSTGTDVVPSGTATATTTTTTPAGPSTMPSAAGNDRAKQIFDQLDTNHDGVLSFEEFSRARFQ